jgi:predicted TIM-barrel fold metal-dependent hydrolase
VASNATDEQGRGWDAHVHVFDGQAPQLPGHYAARHRPLSDIEAVAGHHGVGHLVLVQPSVYGLDNRVLLKALAQAPGRHRGVVAADASLSEHALDALHQAGVRGVRVNRVSPVGGVSDPLATARALAPRLRARGWHVQWYAQPPHWPDIAALHQATGVTAVIDHLAGWPASLQVDQPCSAPAWRALAQLAGGGAWVKLSGWYRLQSAPPHADLLPHARRLHGLFDQRMVWGSDWPHTCFEAGHEPPYASTWQPVVDLLGAAAAERLRSGAVALYA